jgi:acid phosphatase (class A)
MGKFPKEKIKMPKKYFVPWFKDGWDQIELPLPPKDGSDENLAELKFLKNKILNRTLQQKEDFEKQDSATKEFVDHFSAIIKKPLSKEFIRDVASQIFKIVLYYKNKYNRLRPFQAAKKLNFDYPDIETETGHNPSYPSGHTAGVYALATILSKQFPHKKHNLFKYAREVAEGRMIGGVHYPSDILAGKILGNEIAKLYKDPSLLHFEEWLKQ